MANIQELQNYALDNDFGLTAPLTGPQVRDLADYWLPEMRFHPDERYHPIPLENMFSMVLRTWEELSAEERERFRLPAYSPDGSTVTRLDPPWVFKRAGYVNDPGSPTADPYTGYDFTRPVYDVLGNAAGAQEAMAAPDADEDTVRSSGANGPAARMFYAGAQLDGGLTGEVGAPLLPRAMGPDPDVPGEERRTVTVLASLMNLMDLLKYELRLSLYAVNYPPDRLRGAFDIVVHLFTLKSSITSPWTKRDKQEKVLEMIEAVEAGEDPLAVELPFGWSVNRDNWDHVVNSTFLEYTFFYAYNDFERVQVTLFDNTHEGDDEGCCLVFDRRKLAEAANSGDPDALKRVPPLKLLTSVHEEWQHADLVLNFPAPLPADLLRPARDYTRVRVYAAWGSHATYLTPGSHDLVDLDDVAGFAEEHPIIAGLAGLAIILFPGLALLALAVALAEHFIDTEDQTSDDGAWAGPDELLTGATHAVHTEVLNIPMSADDHVYAPGNEELLALCAYTGVWGGHNSFPDVSPPLNPKSGRFFRKLIQ